MKKSPLVFAGCVFSLVAILNLARAIWDVPVTVGSLFTLAPWTGLVVFIIASLFAIWMFSSIRRDEG